MAAGPTGAELVLFLVGLAGLGLLGLALALFLAHRSRRRPAPRPPKRTFEHGRRLARRAAPGHAEAALQALQAAPVGKALSARADERRAEVVIERKRGQPCVQAAGYVAGLFESAWAHEVLVTHPQCAGDRGGPCHYVVHWAAATASGAPAAAASTRGSADARRRWPRARAGAP